ncbi:GntR family transcriptional regulator [Limnohabitans sp. Jir61]|uniref:FadR/GntR family transcriptional regulator n=1 Tax=Limnohabitans sp. Jir61 TaxID=1826168 RepID=UPI000D3A607B|nr:FCD domain-containing protein [Limnohabitans sp. Jir61]PUE32683.1 GntR family transcriptional regulator [Limnohabitans sp. Jir61]
MSRIQLGASLSEKLAQTLETCIREGQLKTGEKLPTENALVELHGVSRTVVREAFSRLKTLGLIETRQGSGAYVKALPHPEAGKLKLIPDGSVDAVLKVVEVRRALEAESAALAAERHTAKSMQKIKQAMRAIDKAVANGGDGVSEDVAFHAAIAQAANNPFLLDTLAYLNQFLENATRVTRANEATRADLEEAVRHEHQAIIDAIEAGDVKAARSAGTKHMLNAAKRIGNADPAFWSSQGRALANRLRSDLSQKPAGTASKKTKI